MWRSWERSILLTLAAALLAAVFTLIIASPLPVDDTA
jgi:hypothetical protein